MTWKSQPYAYVSTHQAALASAGIAWLATEEGAVWLAGQSRQRMATDAEIAESAGLEPSFDPNEPYPAFEPDVPDFLDRHGRFHEARVALTAGREALPPGAALQVFAGYHLLCTVPKTVHGEAAGVALRQATAAMWLGDNPATGLVWDFIESQLDAADATGTVCRAIKRASEQDTPINMSNPTALALLAAAVAQGVFTQAQADLVKSLGAYVSTDAAELGLPVLSYAQIVEALDG